MLHDNILTALKQVSDIPIHLGKPKTGYGSEFYWFTFKEQKRQHNSIWAVNGDQVPSYDELSSGASSLVDPIWSEGIEVSFWDKTLRRMPEILGRSPNAISYNYPIGVLHTTHGKYFRKRMNEQEQQLSFSLKVNY